jgi:hypothetical protein
LPDSGLAICRRRTYLARHVASCLVPLPKASPSHSRPKDGGVLRTVKDARTYMLGLSKDRELRQQWQHACELLLAEADIAALSRQIELALFYDAKLILS